MPSIRILDIDYKASGPDQDVDIVSHINVSGRRHALDCEVTTTGQPRHAQDVTWLLLGNGDMPHLGTLDVDLGLDAEALGDGEYATLIEALQKHGYQQRQELRRFQLVRQISTNDGGALIDIIVDFLMPRDAEIVKNAPPLYLAPGSWL